PKQSVVPSGFDSSLDVLTDCHQGRCFGVHGTCRWTPLSADKVANGFNSSAVRANVRTCQQLPEFEFGRTILGKNSQPVRIVPPFWSNNRLRITRTTHTTPTERGPPAHLLSVSPTARRCYQAPHGQRLCKYNTLREELRFQAYVLTDFNQHPSGRPVCDLRKPTDTPAAASAQPCTWRLLAPVINNSLSVHDATSLYTRADLSAWNRLLPRRPAASIN
uniref:Laminin N-terminal domain-containing protein n=1 Tax=Macrostomum lignano TaxID=282301 RepID=A0A1I8FQQ1_9PLAT